MPPSDNRHTPRPSALEERMSSLRELASNPSFSRLTSSGQMRQIDRFKQDSERLRLPTPEVVAGRYHVIVPFHEDKSMSAVYLTKDVLTDELVIVKMASELSDLEESTKAIRRELRALSAIEHENIVKLIGTGSWEGREFLVLDYVQGADLYLLLGDYSKLSWPTSRLISLQLCDALHAAHNRKIMHDDLKPENIIVSRMDGLKVTLLDFGLAKFVDAPPDDELRIIPGIVAGTFPYMAPETFDLNDYDYRADVYSLGVVIYEMLTGKNPFDGHSIPAMVDLIMKHMPKPPSVWIPLPETVDDIVMRAIAKNPKERFSSMAELREAIRSCR